MNFNTRQHRSTTKICTSCYEPPKPTTFQFFFPWTRREEEIYLRFVTYFHKVFQDRLNALFSFFLRFSFCLVWLWEAVRFLLWVPEVDFYKKKKKKKDGFTIPVGVSLLFPAATEVIFHRPGVELNHTNYWSNTSLNKFSLISTISDGGPLLFDYLSLICWYLLTPCLYDISTHAFRQQDVANITPA